jgi:hypothetical protein
MYQKIIPEGNTSIFNGIFATKCDKPLSLSAALRRLSAGWNGRAFSV